MESKLNHVSHKLCISWSWIELLAHQVCFPWASSHAYAVIGVNLRGTLWKFTATIIVHVQSLSVTLALCLTVTMHAVLSHYYTSILILYMCTFLVCSVICLSCIALVVPPLLCQSLFLYALVLRAILQSVVSDTFISSTSPLISWAWPDRPWQEVGLQAYQGCVLASL